MAKSGKEENGKDGEKKEEGEEGDAPGVEHSGG